MSGKSGFLRRVHTKYGKGTLDYQPVLDFYPSGLLGLDVALGGGKRAVGIPAGRITEVYGQPRSGKTTLGLRLASNVLRYTDRAVLFLDYEQALDPSWAETSGIDTSSERWWFVQPGSLEEGFDILRIGIEEEMNFGLVVADSVASMLPKEEIDNPTSKRKLMQPKAMATQLRQMLSLTREHNVALLFTNHERVRINMNRPVHGTTTPGGSALKFYASVRIALTVTKIFKRKEVDPLSGEKVDRPVSARVKAVVVKNKTAAPYREGSAIIHEDRGFWEIASLVEVATAAEIITKNGSIYELAEDVTGFDEPIRSQGFLNMCEYLEDVPEVCDKIRGSVAKTLEEKGIETKVWAGKLGIPE